MGLGGGGDGDGGNWEGETVMGQEGGRDRDGEMGRDRSSGKGWEWGGGDGKRQFGREGRQWEGTDRGGNRKGETVKGQMGGAEEGVRGEEISQMDMMKCLGGHMECLGGMRLQSFLTLFTRATPGTPASLY